ncbi:MAG: peptidase MA family metallohydrolase [Myxococcota bacterium]|nr:peptidase MA family metallohydrolase [Myxococcota bacterium]
MGRPLAHLMSLCVLLVGLVWGPDTALADGDSPVSMPPRDVAVLVKPSDVTLLPAPADFQRIERGWLTIEFPASVRDRVEALARDAEEYRVRLSAEFGQGVLDQALVRMARNPEQMAELAPEGAPPPAYAAGVAYPSAHLALLALQAPGTWEAPDLVELLRHELAHLALSDAVAGHHVPRWFDEGLAIYESGELPWARRLALADASLGRRLLPLADLDRGFPIDRYEVNVAYAESADFVSFLQRDVDRARFGSLVERVRAGTQFDRALEDAYGTDLRKLEYEWREEVSRRFGLVPALTGGGLLWVLIVVLAIAAWVKRRRQAKAKLARWAREEAEMASIVAAADRERVEKAPPLLAEEDMPARPRPGIPVVEHEGRWYTVH